MASEEVYRTLRYACSQNLDKLRAGEEQLKQWEHRSGYYAELAVRTVNLIWLVLCECVCASVPLERVWRSRGWARREMDGHYVPKEWHWPLLESQRSPVCSSLPSCLQFWHYTSHRLCPLQPNRRPGKAVNSCLALAEHGRTSPAGWCVCVCSSAGP